MVISRRDLILAAVDEIIASNDGRAVQQLDQLADVVNELICTSEPRCTRENYLVDLAEYIYFVTDMVEDPSDLEFNAYVAEYRRTMTD